MSIILYLMLLGEYFRSYWFTCCVRNSFYATSFNRAIKLHLCVSAFVLVKSFNFVKRRFDWLRVTLNHFSIVVLVCTFNLSSLFLRRSSERWISWICSIRSLFYKISRFRCANHRWLLFKLLPIKIRTVAKVTCFYSWVLSLHTPIIVRWPF